MNYKTVEAAPGSAADVVERLRSRVTELGDEIGALGEESARIAKLQRMLDTCVRTHTQPIAYRPPPPPRPHMPTSLGACIPTDCLPPPTTSPPPHAD